MTASKINLPAFPRPIGHNGSTNYDEMRENEAQTGLTKRELFAAMAMQGLIASEPEMIGIAQQAVQCADDLLAELEKP